MDLNLIRIFAAVFEHGSVTKAAEQLHLSQPSVTHGLNRLRRETQDELFVRSGRGIVPTRAAQRLYTEIGHFPSAVETAVRHVYSFDPGSAAESFRVALTDVGQTVFLPTLIPALTRIAPHSTLEIVDLNMETASADLASGVIDLAVASTVLRGRVRSVVIRSDTYHCVARIGRFQNGGPTLEELGDAPRIVTRHSLGHTLVESVLPEPAAGSVYLPAFAAIPPVVVASDLVAFAPRAVIESWIGKWDLEFWPLPGGSFSSLVRGHVSMEPVSSASAWFSDWAIEQMRKVPSVDST